MRGWRYECELYCFQLFTYIQIKKKNYHHPQSTVILGISDTSYHLSIWLMEVVKSTASLLKYSQRLNESKSIFFYSWINSTVNINNSCLRGITKFYYEESVSCVNYCGWRKHNLFIIIIFFLRKGG